MKRTYVVLVIDDDEADTHLIRSLLQLDGYTIDSAQTLTVGLTKLKALDPDIVLLDLGLPDSQGLDTLVTALKFSTNSPIVVLTGAEHEDIALKSLEMGAEDFCHKVWLGDTQLLPRITRFAIERFRNRRAEQEELAIRLKRQAVSISKFADNKSATTISRVLDNDEGAQNLLNGMAHEYRDLVLSMMEPASQNQKHQTELLQGLSKQMVALGAQTHHVIDMHHQALHGVAEKFPPSQQRRYLDNAYLTLIELLGHLVNHYRFLRVDA